MRSVVVSETIIISSKAIVGCSLTCIIIVQIGEIIEHKSGTEVEKNCWYNGYVIGDDLSYVTLDTCTHQPSSNQPSSVPSSSASTSTSSFRINSMNNNPDDETLSFTLNGVIHAFGEDVSYHSCNMRLVYGFISITSTNLFSFTRVCLDS
jgi:hypothetical protein